MTNQSKHLLAGSLILLAIFLVAMFGCGNVPPPPPIKIDLNPCDIEGLCAPTYASVEPEFDKGTKLLIKYTEMMVRECIKKNETDYSYCERVAITIGSELAEIDRKRKALLK